MGKIERGVMEKTAGAGSLTGFPTNAYPQPRPFQQSDSVKIHCFKKYSLQSP